jgi:hypothetical protein
LIVYWAPPTLLGDSQDIGFLKIVFLEKKNLKNLLVFLEKNQQIYLGTAVLQTKLFLFKINAWFFVFFWKKKYKKTPLSGKKSHLFLFMGELRQQITK